ncbi:CAMK family protein kinase [Histomonas meleagridis]|uniref:CAMK family protein kinase n=1 Tax=Histomonas meleagridis TaxID=135588 RepID=UPI0035595A23|nr:CAMK family protein kinase [Histomonas meleagridis]KAH0803860.1 CAMK family protein kinase [Histomonas meleagridis]
MVAKITSKKIKSSEQGKRIYFNEKVITPLLKHPNILSIREVIEAKAQSFQISELYEEGDLLNYIKTHNPSPQICLHFVDQILAAVEYLHENYICHRDIKLENVLLTKKLNVKLCDLGLASITFDGKVTQKCGSYQYVAPEVFASDVYDGMKADMWSCGVLFFCIFSKKFPYRDQNYDTIDFRFVPEYIRPLISSLLRLDPTKRPSAKECRKMKIFDRLQNRVPLFTVSYNILSPIVNPNPFFVSRISQITGQPTRQIKELFLTDKPLVEKLLYHFFTIRMEKKMKKHNSLPIFNVIPEFPCIYQRQYKADSCSVMNEVKKFLLPFNCCISSPVTMNRSIVLNKSDQDSSAYFECLDNSDLNQCTLSLSAHEDCELFSKSLFSFLDTKFDTENAEK